MQVYLDEQPVDLAGPSLGELLDAARARLAEDKRVVVEVSIDGQTLGEGQISESVSEPIGEREVRLTSADPRDLAVETLDQVRGRLNEASQAQAEAAELFQQDKTVDALNRVGKSIEAWLQVQQAVLHSAVLLHINLDEVMVDGEPAHVLTTASLEQLQDIKTFIQANDTVSLADALAYEWPETASKWHALIDTLIDTIRN